MDPMVASWFHAVDQDRSGKITAVELQQALTNGNWTHFNPETCRLMIGMFDKDRSGTIDFNEFQALWNYIHQWKAIFDQFDRDRSQSIDANEFCTVLNQMGYRLSPQFCQMVVTVFNRNLGRLTLDNFIQASVILKTLTDAFRARDSGMTGVVNMNYEDFLTVAFPAVRP